MDSSLLIRAVVCGAIRESVYNNQVSVCFVDNANPNLAGRSFYLLLTSSRSLVPNIFLVQFYSLPTEREIMHAFVHI